MFVVTHSGKAIFVNRADVGMKRWIIYHRIHTAILKRECLKVTLHVERTCRVEVSTDNFTVKPIPTLSIPISNVDNGGGIGKGQ